MLFKNLSKPLSRLLRTEPSPPAAPRQRIAALDSPSPEQVITTILSERDEASRAVTIQELPDGKILRKLAGLREGSSVPASLERLAQARVAQLIDDGVIDGVVGLANPGASLANSAAVLAVAALCRDPAHLVRALESIHDPQQLARLVIEGSSIHLRQLAAQRIEDPLELKRLLKQVRGKDKNVYKILKHKCDALRAEEHRVAQLDSDIQALCMSLEGLSHRFFDPLYVPAFEHFEARWRTLEEQAAPLVQDRARQAIDRCRNVIAGQLRAVAQQAALATQHAALQAARAAAIAQAAEEAQRRNDAEIFASAEAAKVRAAEQQARNERLAAEALAVRQAGALIAKAHSALRDGHTGPAAGLHRAIENKLQAVPVLPAYLARQVQELDAKLNELKEWKDYAVTPKRAELIAAMEALIGSSEHPQSLADCIKDLRSQWKTISKGIVSDSEADWQRFNQAALTAYQPCREYFEAQARRRADNLEKRKGILERLRTFETAQSGEHPDWRAVANVLYEARREWQRNSPVERAANIAIQDEFAASLGRLRARLDAWQAQNAADKKSLIQRAQQLLTKEDSREAVDGVKSLQQLWQQVGAVPREQEGPLWNEFREHCDAVYQKRQQAYTEYTASLDANKARAVALCEETEQLAAQSGPALLEGAGKISQWRAAFEAVGEMPRTEQRALHERFERALRLIDTKISQQRARDSELSFANLLEAAQRIQTYGWAVAQDAAAAEREALKQDAETFIAGVQQWPKGSAAALQDAWIKANAAAGPDTVDNEIALRTLCIRSEIAADLPSPPEDQALRRDYQLQRLVQGMGQRAEANRSQLDALLLEWIRVGPVPVATRESLLVRLLRCR